LWSQSTETAAQTRTEFDFAVKTLKAYDSALGSYGCKYDASSPAMTEILTHACLEKAVAAQKERATGNAIVNQINLEASTVISLSNDTTIVYTKKLLKCFIHKK
jgi:hypothetical protein